MIGDQAVSDMRNEVGLYTHRQVGKVLIGAFSVVILVFIGEALLFPDMIWFFLGTALFFLLLLMFFSTLTVTVRSEKVIISFGPVSLVKKIIPVDQISGISVVRNPWYYGWGIRWIPNGSMYNVSGFFAVELQLNSGRCFRIGTDDPEGLAKVLGKVTGCRV